MHERGLLTIAPMSLYYLSYFPSRPVRYFLTVLRAFNLLGDGFTMPLIRKLKSADNIA